jgi:hypothetical protein
MVCLAKMNGHVEEEAIWGFVYSHVPTDYKSPDFGGSACWIL